MHMIPKGDNSNVIEMTVIHTKRIIQTAVSVNVHWIKDKMLNCN